MYDYLECKNLTIDNLLDGKGKITIMDINPRVCPVGRTPEYIIAKSARISYSTDGPCSKSAADDNALCRYLIKNNHLSPLEMCDVTFHVKAPIFIARQWMRHRCSSFNEQSMRYTRIEDFEDCYNPLQYEEGIRSGSAVNKQGSCALEEGEEKNQIKSLLEKALEYQKEIYGLYNQLCDAGLAKEIARGILPVSQYTHFVYKANLRSLLNFIKLRADHHAQKEIQVYAVAIKELLTPIFPSIMAYLDEDMNSVNLTPVEIEIMQGKKDISVIKSKREANEVKEKLKKLVSSE